MSDTRINIKVTRPETKSKLIAFKKKYKLHSQEEAINYAIDIVEKPD